jgi:hypothetical protein
MPDGLAVWHAVSLQQRNVVCMRGGLEGVLRG